MDLSTTIEPDSTQINADDLIGGPQTFTITRVSSGTSEQPVNIHLEGTDRAYRPSKSMRRVLLAAWGKDSSAYVGRSLTLYRDPTVKFRGDEVGGIKISHLSHIEKSMAIALTVARGQRRPHQVEPLVVRDWLAEIAAATSMEALKAIYQAAPKSLTGAIAARKAELQGAGS